MNKTLISLLVAGAVLGAIALRAPEPTYVPPADTSPEVVPVAIQTSPAAGFAIRVQQTPPAYLLEDLQAAESMTDNDERSDPVPEGKESTETKDES